MLNKIKLEEQVKKESSAKGKEAHSILNSTFNQLLDEQEEGGEEVKV
jgi:hypothetical protein